MLQTEPELPWPRDAVEVGVVVDAWGVKGWIKVQPHAADPQALYSSRRWFVQPTEGRPGTLPTTCLRIAQARAHGDAVVAQVRGIDDRSAAQAFKGARIFVSRQSFPTADPDEYYWVDLIGLDVVNRQGEALGRVTGLLDTGPHSVLRIAAEDAAEERLIPFVGTYVDAVDLAARRIVVDWGLDY